MKKLTALAAYALTAPVITFGIGSAFAAESPSDATGAKDQRTTQEQMSEKSNKDRYSSEEGEYANKDNKGMMNTDRPHDQRMGTDRTNQHMNTQGKMNTQAGMNSQGTFVSKTPANSLRSDDLIGADLRTRGDDESIGPVTDLVIDENGKIAAVIVEVGGFLGLGEKEVAISWDSIDSRRNEDDDGYIFSVDTTEDALTDAPEYDTAGTNKSGSKKY